MGDPASDERVGQVYKTEGHPESFQVEASGGHIFVNVPDAGMVVESIDRKPGAVAKWPLKGLKGNYAMALNEEDYRLFTVTQRPATKWRVYAQRANATTSTSTLPANASM